MRTCSEPCRLRLHPPGFSGPSVSPARGKTTLADALVHDLRSQGHAVLGLDGDELRNGLCHGLGFSDAGRSENLRRAAEVARLGNVSNLCVVASFITPLASQREMVRGILGSEILSLIHVTAPLEVCRQRDVKGLYARAQVGQVAQITGLSSAFEATGPADLVIHTDLEDIPTSSRPLLGFVLTRLGAP